MKGTEEVRMHEGAERAVFDREAAEEALRQSEERYRSLAEAAMDMIFIIDRDDTIVYVNTFAAAQMGLRPDDMIGKKREFFFPPSRARTQRQSLEQVFTSGEALYNEVLTTFPGGERWLDSWLVPLRDKEGNVTSALGISRDTTKRKRAEQMVERLNEELEKRVAERTAQLEVAIREQEAFSYSVSHELRTWLNHVRGFSQVLAAHYGERLDEEGREFLGHIAESSLHMEKVVDDLLNLSLTTRTEMSFETVALGEMALEILGELRKKEPERRVEFLCPGEARARGDSGLLRLLLENLLANSWKFTSRREAAVIEFGALKENGKSLFFVRDNGVGFDMAKAENIFQPFQRLHCAEEYGGTGIGLAIAQRIVQRHGGCISAESSPDKGATFYFTL